MAHWIPLESNPAVINKFVASLGVGGDLHFNDVLGLDADLLAMVPQPVAAVIMNFPITATYHTNAAEEAAQLAASPQVISPSVFYMKQTIGNACGTIAVLHALANCVDKITIGEGHFKTFLAQAHGLSPLERGALLESSGSISEAHEASAQEGQSEVPDADTDVNMHFVAFVEKDGHLYELDGIKDAGPINHGPTSADTLLQDAVTVVRQFMARDPDELRFMLIALAPGQPDDD